MANPTSNAFPNLGNDPLEDKPPPRVMSKRELRELRKKEKKEKEIEVRFGSHLFQENIVLILLQEEKRREKLEREKEEREAIEHKEKLEVRYHPPLSAECY